MSAAPIPPKLKNLVAQAAAEEKDAPERLFAAASARAELDIWLDQLAQAAKQEGHSWADLGKILGVTKQAAHKRFSGTQKKDSVYKDSVYVVDWTEEGTGEMVEVDPKDAAKLRELRNRMKEKHYKKGDKLDPETLKVLERTRKRGAK